MTRAAVALAVSVAAAIATLALVWWPPQKPGAPARPIAWLAMACLIVGGVLVLLTDRSWTTAVGLAALLAFVEFAFYAIVAPAQGRPTSTW